MLAFVDPLTGKEELVFTVLCQHCKNPLATNEINRYEGCCERCWELGNEQDLAVWNYHNQYEA